MIEQATTGTGIEESIRQNFGSALLASQTTRDGIPTYWIQPERIVDVLRHAREASPERYAMLYDLTAIDERFRAHREGQPASDFTVVYMLFSFDRNAWLRLKVPLIGDFPSIDTATGVWMAANWFEREVWDMFGITFRGHPNLRRILMPKTWQGHPLRKEHPARATEMEPFTLPDYEQEHEQEMMEFRPEEWGMKPQSPTSEFMFLNVGPQHPGTHGVFRIVTQMEGEEIIDALPEIGFHHRGAEKMGERQTWHSYIPYTDRVDYLGGVMNNFPYVMAVEALAGIEVPPRARVIRIMLAELFRIASHLVWYGTFAQDIGALSPVFYMFNDRERIFKIIEAICGFRMHPAWFRIGGTAADLPEGWDGLVLDFVKYMPPRLKEYDALVMKNRIFKMRTIGVGAYSKEEAIDWSVTGPGLRATGFEWDFRKKRPYSDYDQFEFDIPTATHGDCYDRGVVRVEEIRQSLRIIEQCVKNMPSGHYKSDHPLTTPPRKDRTMHDIETLINHFLNVTWGPVIPPGEAFVGIEATKGNNGYYLVSDGNTESYRTRVRGPSFAHLQMVPMLCRGGTLSDLMAILGSIDFVMAEVDR